MKKVITYGTFDLLHPGHVHLLKKAKKLGEFLIVGLSTDKFARTKGKLVTLNYRERKLMLEALRYVDKVIPEHSHDQKIKDVQKYSVDFFVMGGDYRGAHNFIKKYCKVRYVTRVRDLSSSNIKKVVVSLHNGK